MRRAHILVCLASAPLAHAVADVLRRRDAIVTLAPSASFALAFLRAATGPVVPDAVVLDGSGAAVLRELALDAYRATGVVALGVVPAGVARVDAFLGAPVREAPLAEAIEAALRDRGHLVGDGTLSDWDF